MATSPTRYEPVVLDGIKLDAFVKLLLDKHAASSMLVVCSSRDAFLHKLHMATARSSTDDEPHPLLLNTLRMIGQAQTLRAAFCPSLEAVRAFLGTYKGGNSDRHGVTSADRATQPLLAILDLLDIHRGASSWSAQGLSRTLAVAVEAAHRAGQKLVVAECPLEPDTDAEMGEVQHPEADAENEESAADGEVSEARARRNSVWDEQVAILNVTTKSFGVGERSWVGRTVRIRKVAERWCAVKKIKLNSEFT